MEKKFETMFKEFTKGLEKIAGEVAVGVFSSLGKQVESKKDEIVVAATTVIVSPIMTALDTVIQLADNINKKNEEEIRSASTTTNESVLQTPQD
jgi:hypothetical protein